MDTPRYLRYFIPALLILLSCLSANPTIEEIRTELENKKGTPSEKASLEILNISYDPTGEFYEAYNPLFIDWWKERTGQEVSVVQSHGGSGKQARSIISGLEADVATLAIPYDIDSIQTNTGIVGEKWQERLPNNSSPYFSTIVFLVRKGNPKGITDWADLTKQGIGVITPNPKISGAARLAYLAAWGWALKHYNGDQNKAKDYLRQLYANTLVLDTGARGSTATFMQRRMGDVLISWENEAYLIKEKAQHEEFEIVYPSMSIKAEPPVTWMERYIKEKGTEDVAQFYLKYLYSIPAQELLAKNHYRPADPKILKANSARLPEIEMISTDEFGNWNEIQNQHFSDGGIFDQIYLKENQE